MSLRKHGTGEVLREEGDLPKTASAWSDADNQALAEENRQADEKQAQVEEE